MWFDFCYYILAPAIKGGPFCFKTQETSRLNKYFSKDWKELRCQKLSLSFRSSGISKYKTKRQSSEFHFYF